MRPRRSGGIELQAGGGYLYDWARSADDENDERIDPIPHQLIRTRSGSGFIAIEFLAGRRLFGPLHMKGGFTYGLAGDLHPFQPLLVFSFTP